MEISLGLQWLKLTIQILSLIRQQLTIWFLDLENLKFRVYLIPKLIFFLNFNFIIYFQRTHVLDLNRVFNRNQEPYGGVREFVVTFLDRQSTFGRQEGHAFEVYNQRFAVHYLQNNS